MVKITQALMEFQHTGDGVDTTPRFRSDEMRGLWLTQLQMHTNAEVTYSCNYIKRLTGSEATTLNGSIILDNLNIEIEQQVEFLFSNVAVNETIKIIGVMEDRND